MDPRSALASLSPKNTAVTENQTNGGASSGVGQPGKSMYQRPFDDFTRPMTRGDLLNFLTDPNQMDESERQLLIKVMSVNMACTFGGFFTGFFFSRYLPWKRLEVLQPPKHYIFLGRLTMGFSLLSITYIASQRWALQQIMKLDENSPLLFNIKRFLLTQRGNMMFARAEVREISKAEIEQRGGVGSESAQDVIMKQPSPDGTINTEFSLAQQQLLPIAQTGYKPPPR